MATNTAKRGTVIDEKSMWCGLSGEVTDSDATYVCLCFQRGQKAFTFFAFNVRIEEVK